jgi:hypothetical protein
MNLDFISEKQYWIYHKNLSPLLELNEKDEEIFYEEWEEFTDKIETPVEKYYQKLNPNEGYFEINDDWTTTRTQSMVIWSKSEFNKVILETISDVILKFRNEWVVFIELVNNDLSFENELSETDFMKPSGYIIITINNVFALKNEFNYGLIK